MSDVHGDEHPHDPAGGSFFDDPAHDDDPVHESDQHEAAGRRRADRRRSGCLPLGVAALVVVVLLGGLAYVAKSHLSGLFGGPPDYSGPGSGSVVVQVHPGDSSAEIGQDLKRLGVVKSVDAFTAAARANSKSVDIEVGYYQLRKQMKASEALDVLVDPHDMIQSLVVVPEGARVRNIIATIVAKTTIKRSAVIAALKHPSSIGLPAQAHGNPEGYLFPATYSVTPGETAVALLRQMVAKSVSEDKALDIAAGAHRLGLTPEQVVTVASILEYEAKRDQDYPKVARAIYNRLKAGMPIQSDATVSYANGVSGQIWTSAAQRASSSPYNTYQHTGLPPGPIGSPGVTTLKAAMNPTPGPWLYWVVVNLRTGRTVFSTTLAQHEAAVQQFQRYCQTSTAC